MAEIVGFHVERMIPELEQMERLKLFKREEISEIIKKRKEFEYKIERTMKDKQDFTAYINYELKLIHDIKLRRDKYRISEKKDEIEYAVTRRVTKLYKLALSYFKADLELWLAYIKFCTHLRFVNVISEAFKQMLQLHGDKMHLWKLAAKWELKELNNIDGALKFLKTGLHHHPDSRELYMEAFKLELMAATHKRASTTNTEDESKRKEKAMLRAEVHFKTSVKVIGDDVEYIVSLLEIATEFDFTEELQRQIVEYLTKNCWKSELMWHTMAQRELRGNHYDNNNERKSRIQLCISVYKSSVKILPTIAMWEKYLDTLIDLYLDKTKKKTSMKDILEQALEEAYESKFLLEKHYLMWVEILDDNPKKPEVLTMATKTLPQSVELWLTHLRYYIEQEDSNKIRPVFQEAVTALGKKSLPIYKTLIQYYNMLPNCAAEVKNIFEEGIAQEPEISLELRPLYIEWIYLTKNIKFARQEYAKLSLMSPYCLELHQKMIDLEIGRLPPVSVTTIRNIHKLVCQQFGKERCDVWIDHIKFELNHGDPRHVSDIYNQAKNTLDENLVSSFCADFSILNATS